MQHFYLVNEYKLLKFKKTKPISEGYVYNIFPKNGKKFKTATTLLVKIFGKSLLNNVVFYRSSRTAKSLIKTIFQTGRQTTIKILKKH